VTGNTTPHPENDTPEDPAVETPRGAAEGIDAPPGEEDLDTELAQARGEAAAARDAMLRMQAEMDNLRKRLIRDLERSQKRALEGVMSDLLPVYDSFERGLEAAGESATVESLREGSELTLKMLGQVLAKHGLVEIDPLGQPFDPEWHEAMTTVPSPEHAPGTVIEVLQKGFRLHERLIRPAMVVVSREAD